jgi:hypothetical protein
MRNFQTRSVMLSLLLLAGAGSNAEADEREDMGSVAETMSIDRSTPRELLADQAVIPGYWHLGTSLAFASPSGTPSNSGLNIPTTTRLAINGRTSLGESFEVAGGATLPPKQSEITDDPPLFGGYLMGRWAINRRQALYIRTEAERLMQITETRDDGAWAEAAAGWDGRSFMDSHKLVSFAWNLGLGGGHALATDAEKAPWLAEAIAGIGMRFAFRPRGGPGMGFTAGSDFRFPILSGGDAYWAEGAPTINPQTRVDLYTTFFVSLSTGWDITATLAHRDRGEIDTPETILPVLGGGYDQQQILLGFSYSGVREPEPKVLNLAAMR